MSNRDNLKRLVGVIAPGKDGWVAAIVEASVDFKADSSILPSEWSDLSDKQAVALYGGYLVAHKGFNADQVYGFANVIYKHNDKIDLTATKQVITDLLSSLEAKMAEENLEASNNALELGEAGEDATKRLLKSLTDTKIAASVHLTRKAITRLMEAREIIDSLLSKEAVESTPVSIGVKVAS
jgi:hypothetical protein